MGLFADTPGGLVGNDDSGGMSSWYVWSSLGLFPVAGQDCFLIGSPLFAAARLRLPGGHHFSITAADNASQRPYVAAAWLNGTPLAKPWLRWADIANGSTLELTMSDSPAAWSPAASSPT